MDNARFGGHCSQQEITSIMVNNASRLKLNYSHKKENRWNLWMTDSGMTLSFILNNGLFIPSISGIERRTLEKFYSTCPADVDSWVRTHIRTYLEVVKSKLTQVREEDLMPVIEETEVQRYNREHDEFLTDEEYQLMYQQETEQLADEGRVLAKRLKPIKKKDKQIPGQLSLFDMEEFKNYGR